MNTEMNPEIVFHSTVKIENYILQAQAADIMLRAMIAGLESDGFRNVPDTLIWEKRGADGKVLVTVSL